MKYGVVLPIWQLTVADAESLATKAESLGLRGFARNLPDGRVEVLACGEQATVEQFIAWLWEGSPASKVTGVETTSCDASEAQRLTGFSSA